MTFPPPRDEPYGRADFLRDFADEFAERARYHGHYRDAPERLRLLCETGEFKYAGSLENWAYLTEAYPKFAISADALTRDDNEEVPVRAHYLRHALGALLRIVDAPENMRADVDRFFGEFRPREAPGYAKAQAELLRDEEATISEVSRRSGLDRSTIHKLLKSGVLVRIE